MFVKPRNSTEWSVALCCVGLLASAIFWFALGDFLAGWLSLTVAYLLYTSMTLRRAAFLAGWFGGRSDLVTQLQEAKDEDAAQFMRRMMDRDMQMLADQLGEREMHKFVSQVEMQAARHIARSDGSHDNL